MPSRRSGAAELSRLLASVAAPVYLLDEDRRLLYANRACAEFAGCPIDELLGTVLAYATEASNDRSTINALCPPPGVFAGERQCGFVYALDDSGGLRRRRADFIPLMQVDGGLLVLAIVADADAAAEEGVEPAAGPASPDDPVTLHECLLRFRREQARRYSLDRLVGDSPAMARVRAQVHAAIASRSNAAIVGPAGSGRAYVARLIHYGQRNGDAGLLLPLDGALVGDEVLRSTVQTLAARPRNSAATLLVRDPEQLSEALQTELTRLVSQRFRDVRLLATSESPFDELVAAGGLRSDLAALMSTIEIRLPPLAERRADIPLLAQTLVEELNSAGTKQLGGFSPEAMDAIVAYPWPGNLAELAQFVTAAFDAAEGPLITPADLPKRLHYAAGAARRSRRSDEPIVLEKFLADVELELIQRALKQAKGNKARAARLLGMTRPRLYRRLVQLGLEAPLERAKEPVVPATEFKELPEFVEEILFEEPSDE